MATIWQPFLGKLCEDRPLMQITAAGGVRLELTARNGRAWVVELTPGDCEAVAEAIRWGPPGRWPTRAAEPKE